MKTEKEQEKLSTWYRKYRVVRDNYSGYEAQCWRIWWPFWWQLAGRRGRLTNTNSSLDEAIDLCRNHKNPIVAKL